MRFAWASIWPHFQNADCFVFIYKLRNWLFDLTSGLKFLKVKIIVLLNKNSGIYWYLTIAWETRLQEWQKLLLKSLAVEPVIWVDSVFFFSSPMFLLMADGALQKFLYLGSLILQSSHLRPLGFSSCLERFFFHS